LLTDANGRVALTITSTTGASTERVTITATPEGQTGTAQSSIDVDWETQDYGLVDLNTTAASLGDSTRTIRAGGTYDMKLAVMDQWFTPAPSADYRLRVSGNGVTQGFVELVAGGATVKVTDPGIFTVAGQFVSTVDVQKKSSAGTWADTADDADITNVLVASAGVTLAADASSIYSPTSTNADLSDAVAAAALVEIDSRLARTAEPDYKNSLLVSGVVANSATSAAANGAVVTISGPSNVLFKNGSVSKRGSLTLLANANGLFEVELFSTTAQTDSVITVTSLGGTATTKVTFTGIGVGEGTKLDVTAPASVRPASTFQVKAKLSDVFGNGVEATAGRVKVTYTGPGIVFGTLPDKTDKNGELMFSVLLGSNDTGNVVVTVSYDQNGDADYVDAKDLNTTKTITVGTGAASGTGKVNVGSFNGKLVVYASGLNGKRISWKVGGNWGSAVADSNYDIFNRPTPRAGVTLNVEIFVDGKSALTKSVVTR
jgi:hypothetical protein